jgi:hypothetical protein
LDIFNIAQLICLQWAEMFLNNYWSEIHEVRKKGSRGNKRPVTDFVECMGTWR